MAIDSTLPILVVDEYQAAELLTYALLKQIGYSDVDHAPDVAAALEMFRHKGYRLILSDWDMKPLSGRDLLREIRSLPGGGYTRFIMTTPEEKGDHGMAASRSGADGFLAKPLSAESLQSKIESLFGAGGLAGVQIRP